MSTVEESWFMVLLIDKSDHKMIWLPDGDQVPDREKHVIQNPKLMLTLVWNLHGFQVVDVMPCRAMPSQKERRSRPPKISEIFSLRSLLGVERNERRLFMHAGIAKSHAAHMTRPFYDDNFLRIALHPRHPPYSQNLDPSDFVLFGHLKTAFKDSSSDLHINFFGSPRNSGRNKC
jgi:hypothetical protein